MTLDLKVPSQLQLLLDLIVAERDDLLLVFIAPPCGTASRARGRPIKSSLLRGRRAPQPLRTDDQPDGKDNLSGTDTLKTELVTQLYATISEAIPFGTLFWHLRCCREQADPLLEQQAMDATLGTIL